jgi:hypothetical protein
MDLTGAAIVGYLQPKILASPDRAFWSWIGASRLADIDLRLIILLRALRYGDQGLLLA